MKRVRLIILVITMLLCMGACEKKEDVNDVSREENSFCIEEKEETFEVENKPIEDLNNEFAEFSEDTTPEERVYVPVDEGVYNLKNDLKNGIITVDDYVLYSLYDVYGDDRLDSKYESTLNMPVDLNYYIEKYIDELSEETLQYYWDKLCLKDIVEFGSEDEFITEINTNQDKFKNPFVLNAHAEEKRNDFIIEKQKLDNIILSDNGNFVIWYSETGTNAITKEDAIYIGEVLENAVTEYESMTGLEYTFVSSNFNSVVSSEYQKQRKLLIEKGYDAAYLDIAMQVYVVDIPKGACASYNYYSYALDFYVINQLFRQTDGNSPVLPYIMINRSTLNNLEYAKQVCTHEVFHHIQELLCNGDRQNSDAMMNEATANWFSAKVSKVISGNYFLNEWATTYILNASSLFTDLYNNEGTLHVGYALFSFLQFYEKHVEDGFNKIIDSVHNKDGLEYLESQATQDECIAIMKDMALHNLVQDPNNGITLSGTILDVSIPITAEITSAQKVEEIKIYNKIISKLHIDYYSITFNDDWFNNGDFCLNFEYNEENTKSDKLWMYVIGANNIQEQIEYKLISSLPLNINELSYELSSDSCKDYDKLYIAVTNASMTTDYNYSLNVSMENVVYSTNTEDDSIEMNPVVEEIVFETEEDEYYYNMAVSVRNQIEEFFVALKSGDVETLKKYSKNVNDDYNDDTIYPALEIECMPQILRILCKDVQFYFSDDMLFGLADDLRAQYENGENYIYVNMPYTVPNAWYTTEMYVSSFDKGDIAQEPIIETEQEALDIIAKISAMVPMECYDSLYVVLPEAGTEDNISININHIIETYNMPEPEYDIYFNDGNEIYKVEQPNAEDYYNNYLILLGQNMAPYIFDKIPGCPDEYTDKETWELLENYLNNMDLEGLQTYLFSVLEESECEKLYNAQNKYGVFAELNTSQKDYVNNCISKYFEFRVDDFTCIRRNKEERVGCFYISAPIYEYIMNNEKFSKCSEDMLKWSMDNNANYMKHMDFYTDVSLEWTYDMLKEFLIEAYYPLIGYAKNNVQ